jgi:hypothetical protein
MALNFISWLIKPALVMFLVWALAIGVIGWSTQTLMLLLIVLGIWMIGGSR